jgi:hypothetical protein
MQHDMAEPALDCRPSAEGRRWRASVVLACALALVGCTSLQTVAGAQGREGGEALIGGRTIAAKDTLTVTPRQGERFVMEVVSVSGSEIEGTVGTAKTPLTVRLADVEKVERREFDGVRTGLLVLSIVSGVALVYLAAKAVAVTQLANTL